MSIRRPSSEQGQALVLILLAMIALFGFVALALDGGAVYSNRRTAQNAADAAAYAGAASIANTVKQMTINTFDCTPVNTNASLAVAAAQQRAVSNNFTLDGDLSNKNGVEVVCQAGTEPYVDVHVQVTSPVETSLMHFVNLGKMVNTVDSVVRIQPRVILGEGQSIIALRNTCGNSAPHAFDGGLNFNGSFGVVLNAGGAHSNNCAIFNGVSGTLDGDLTYTPPGTTDWNSGMTSIDQPHASGILDLYPEINRLSTIVKAKCDTLTTWGPSANGHGDINGSSIQPGKYRNITIHNGNVDFTPGLYCITGSVTINGGNVTGDNITFYVYAKDNGPYSSVGNFDTTGGPHVEFSAPAGDCGDPFTVSCHGAVGGTLILFMSSDNKSLYSGTAPEVVLGGNSTSSYGGSIIAPYTMVELGGNTNADDIANFGAQIIADSVWIHGKVSVTINYNSDTITSWPAHLQLQR